MRRILVDAARRKRADKHGGGRDRVELADVPPAPPAAEDPLAARVVELRHFGGLSIEEAATTLGLSRATAYRHWTYARDRLRDAIAEAGPGRADPVSFRDSVAPATRVTATG